MDIKRPSLIVPSICKYKDINEYVYLIFSNDSCNPIQLSFTENIKGIENNLNRAKQLALDIVTKEYKNTKIGCHNVIVRFELGDIKFPLWVSDNNKKKTIGGCIADKNGLRFLDAKHIKFHSKYKINNSCNML